MSDLSERLSYVGTVHGRREIRIIAQVQGTVVELPEPEGAAVAPGDLVAKLHTPELAAAVERLRAEKDYWCRRHEADLRLVEANALPQEEAEASSRACRSAVAGLEEAEARLRKSRELAPVRGTILSWLVEPGQHVMPGQPLLVLGDRSLEVHVEVVEADLRRGVEVGLPVVARPWQGSPFPSQVAEIAPMATGPARTFTVKIPVPDTHGGTLRTGASLQVELVLDSCSDCVAVPREAILTARGVTHVFLVRDGRAVRQEVTAGIEDGGLVQVSMPWTEGDLVAVSNVTGLADDVPVLAVEVEGARP
ncbi:efflux RND transporter periplasmic adaptor subunit [bacterium]|nr:efflux RND transporter periplasmic adaptor subunit [bacterium]